MARQLDEDALDWAQVFEQAAWGLIEQQDGDATSLATTLTVAVVGAERFARRAWAIRRRWC